MASTEDSNWAWLPQDLLDSILKKLAPISDYVRFAATCKQWRCTALKNYRNQRIKTRSDQVPLLMIPNDQDSGVKIRRLYSVTEDKIHNFQLQVPYNKRCSGSSHGWLAFTEENMAITLINPFTNTTINLPAITKIRLEDCFKPEYAIEKVILSKDPSISPKDYEVTAIYSCMGRLAFIKAGDKVWTYVHKTPPEKFPVVASDAIYYKGKVHAVTNWGKIISVDSTSLRRPKLKKILPRKTNCSNKAYLVESSSGELLMVRRFFRYNKGEMWGLTSRFEVSKLLCLSGSSTSKRVKVKNLGGDALFLGDNQSLSVVASEFPGCRENCIYFTDDFIDLLPAYEEFGPRDMGVYNLEDGTIGMHYISNPLHSQMPPPVWVLPSLHKNWLLHLL